VNTVPGFVLKCRCPTKGGSDGNKRQTDVGKLLTRAVPKITPDQASDMIKKGNTLVVDVRDAPEVSASGKIAGAVNVSRGMLEFRADPDSPYHDKNFDKEKTVILYCAFRRSFCARREGPQRIWVTRRSIMSADLKIGPARSKRSKNRRTTVRLRPVIDRNICR